MLRFNDLPHMQTRRATSDRQHNSQDTLRGLLSGLAVTDSGIRENARAMGRQVALNGGRYWQTAKTAPDGPIDVIDMFSGCGGMSAGFRTCNGLLPLFRLIMAVDVDPVANATYAHNFGITPQEADVADLAQNPRRLKKIVEQSGRRPDHPLVLIGCAPCQGFSSHRNRLGNTDRRNPLFVDFARIAAILKPDAIVIENVPL